MTLLIKIFSIFILLFWGILNVNAWNECSNTVNKNRATYYLDNLSNNINTKITTVTYNWFTVDINQTWWIYSVERYISDNNFWVKVNWQKIITLNFDNYEDDTKVFKNSIFSDFNFLSETKLSCPTWYKNYFAYSDNSWYVCKKTETLAYEIPCELPELTAEISFIEQEYWSTLGVSNTAILWSPVPDWVYGELTANKFINDNIRIRLLCTSDACDSNTSTSKLITENWIWSLTIEDKYWRTLTKDFQVWKINKTPPVWEIIYSPNNDIWVNTSKTVTLQWIATVFGEEDWNRDWLIWDARPTSEPCYNEWWCTWTLSIEDSAWNILTKDYFIKNIDNTSPWSTLKEYAEVNNWKRKYWLTCTDAWWSGCEIEWEQFLELSRWTHTKCVYDNAGNIDCRDIVVSIDANDYSDTNAPWINWARKIWLKCEDDLSGCQISYVDNNISENWIYELTVKDNAEHTTIKQFKLEHIDNDKPDELFIVSIDSFYASEKDRIQIKWKDYLSWIKEIKYKWNNSCDEWTYIDWIWVNNNEVINYKIAWAHKLYVCAIDNAWNIKEVTKNLLIYPWYLSENNTDIIVSTSGDKFANNKDVYNYTLILRDEYGNLIYNKELNILEYDVDETHKKLYTSMINIPSWDLATSFIYNDKQSNDNWKIYFSMKSLSPWEFTQRFKLSLNNWWNNYVDNTSENIFYKYEKDSDTNMFRQPIAWNISVIAWWDTPEMWKVQKYQIELNKVDDNSLVDYSNWKLNISSSTINHLTLWHFWNTFELITNDFWNNLDNYLGFSWSIDANSNFLDWIELGLNNLVMSYKLWWNDIKYYLNDFWINWCTVSTLWLKVIWTLQWDGKADITWQKTNFSDLSKWELRSKIRMSWYKLIKGLSSWDIVNWIKYVEWNIEISWDNLWFETLIVKDWNVIINWDLNISNNKLWIIILKDNYLIESDYNNVWNIYVNKNVEKINAIIYADWAFRSTNSDWYSYTDWELNNKLILNWSLFTRNTIGWATKANTEWVLPWWQETDNYNLAEVYDLNFIRKVDNSCDIDEDYSFLIRYNSSIQTNPPVWFSVK